MILTEYVLIKNALVYNSWIAYTAHKFDNTRIRILRPKDPVKGMFLLLLIVSYTYTSPSTLFLISLIR